MILATLCVFMCTPKYLPGQALRYDLIFPSSVSGAVYGFRFVTPVTGFTVPSLKKQY